VCAETLRGLAAELGVWIDWWREALGARVWIGGRLAGAETLRGLTAELGMWIRRRRKLLGRRTFTTVGVD
jgi:hypothetical protein